MNPLEEAQLYRIASALDGYRRVATIDLSDGSLPPELAWIPSEDIALSGAGYIFYYETVEQARSLRETLGQGGFTNCRVTSNGLPVTFVCISEDFEDLYS